MTDMKAYQKKFIFGACFGIMSVLLCSGFYFLLSSESFLSSIIALGFIFAGLIGGVVCIVISSRTGHFSFSEYQKDSGIFGLSIGIIILFLNIVLLIVWVSVLVFDIHMLFGTDQIDFIYIASGITVAATALILIIQMRIHSKRQK